MTTQEALLYAQRCARRTFSKDTVGDAEEHASIGAMAVLALLEEDPNADGGLVWVVCQRAMIDEWRKTHGRAKESPRRAATVELEEWHAPTEATETEDAALEESYEAVAQRFRAAQELLEGLPRLSPRQREVLQLLADGRTTRSIAADLHVSLHTVQSHVKSTRRVLGVKTTAAAVAKGIALGEVTPPKV